MTVHESITHFENIDIKILGTDINSKALNIARKGKYNESNLNMIDKQRRKKWFISTTAQNTNYLEASDSLKNIIYFNYLNLFETWPMKGLFDVIFCRNIFLYFSKEKTQYLLDKLDKYLCPGGFLIVGHAESAFVNTLKYKRVAETIYEKPIINNTGTLTLIK